MSRSSDPVKLAYDSFVPAEGEDITLSPVILLHGMTSSRTSWLDIPQMIADATKRKVYALDARNHGESPWTDEMDYYVMAEDVEKFMDDVKIPKAVLVGHSMGGKTAMALTLSKGKKVEKLVVEDISPTSLPPTEMRFPTQYLKLMRESLSHVPEGSDIETAGKIIGKYILSHTPQEHKSKMAPRVGGMAMPLKMTEKGVAWQANIDVIEKAFFNNPRHRREITGDVFYGEVLFIYGTESVYGVAKSKDAILKLFPMAVLSSIEGATHLVHLEFPEEFCAKVVEFIGKK